VGQQTIGAAISGGDINGGGGYCFVGMTKIATPLGGKYIHDIRLKDIVLTFDPKTGERAIGTVTDKFEHLVSKYLLVEFADGHTTGTTAHHKYWVDGEYVAIGGLDYVMHWRDGWKKREIVSKRLIEEETILYNITVDGFHNYFANGDAVSNRKDEPPGEDFPPLL
jgi:hypothetical protein